MTISYGKQPYWDERYATDKDFFDWFQRYSNLQGLIEEVAPCPKSKCRVLIPGCGNSALSRDMIQDGYGSVKNIDWSQVCIDNMSRLDPKGEYEKMDARNLTFRDNSFDLVIAKGLIDSLSCGENYVQHISQTLHEIHRVLSEDGTLMCISYAAPEQRRWHFEGEQPGEFSWSVDTLTVPKPTLPTMDIKMRGDDPNHHVYICRKRLSKEDTDDAKSPTITESKEDNSDAEAVPNDKKP